MLALLLAVLLVSPHGREPVRPRGNPRVTSRHTLHVQPLVKPVIPASAISSGNLTGSPRWMWDHDAGTVGTSTGSSTFPVADPSLDGAARSFSVPYSLWGGERYHINFANDPAATHFAYDAYVYLDDPPAVGFLEMDVNQVLANGQTVIFGYQCSIFHNTWDVTTNFAGEAHWVGTGVPCDPRRIVPHTWHHIQLASHRGDAGKVTYDWVGFDGVYSVVNMTLPNGLALGWTPGAIIVNFQVGGTGAQSGMMSGAFDKLTVYRW